jgi:hypothetical protein
MNVNVNSCQCQIKMKIGYLHSTTELAKYKYPKSDIQHRTSVPKAAKEFEPQKASSFPPDTLFFKLIEAKIYYQWTNIGMILTPCVGVPFRVSV